MSASAANRALVATVALAAARRPPILLAMIRQWRTIASLVVELKRAHQG